MGGTVAQRVRLVDVAQRAGVSPTTVSLVLAGRGAELRISADAQRRVMAAAEELAYRSSRVSASLRTGRTHTLGFVSDTVATSRLAGDMIQGAVEAARERGMMLLIGETEGRADLESGLLETMLDRGVDGIIFASMFTRAVGVPDILARSPAVLLNCVADGPAGLTSVVPDEFAAGRDAAQVLLDAGHREGIHLIGVGSGPGDAPPGSIAAAERTAGIDTALSEAGVEVLSRRGCLDWLPEHGYRAAVELLAGHRPQAVICFNDRLALGVLQALNDVRLVVPEDVSLVSFDDQPIAQWLRPKLTTVALPHQAMGRVAVETLAAEIDAQQGDLPSGVRTIRIPMPLRVRESVAPPSSRRPDHRISPTHPLRPVTP
ncbi:LacI family DNA-binding transcriptional regulator [Nakamurella flavida]|uniref:LacI family DNA-binding transcriptional regulator n=1 Tax=Nakamurella flavida TaxID=363630 RepID=A0A938YNK7_9ACTN|nr:LacI family DNA-binding transcriptional regulator [Nakamurella flavida]MBM9478023.1 LacI family DNA-binding transcriptional regulator [Nakamurella flavida]MDP9778260.1 LacI family transcriptional regulator [Nakamurella flavida]